VTARRASNAGAAAPTPRLLLLGPVLLIVLAAAITPDAELYSNQGDVRLYLEKATQLLAGLVPYRDFPFEYPPAAFVPMAVPLVAWPFGPPSPETYKWLFSGWVGMLMLGLGLVLARIVRLGGRAGMEPGGPAEPLGVRLRSMALRLILLTAGAALALTWRFDLFPALLVMVALWAALDGRPAFAGIAIGLGVLAKLYPLAVVPALVVPWLSPVDVRRVVRFGVATGLTVILGMAPFVALAGDDAFTFLRDQAERGLQIESIGGGLALLGGLIGGAPIPMSFGYSAAEAEGPFAAAWLALLPAATAIGFGLLALIGWRRISQERAGDADGGRPRAATIVTLAFASVLVLLATSKVFSIQYVVWIVPFAALLRGRRFWLAAATVALTMPIHPLLYGALVDQEAIPILILNARNALFAMLLASVMWDIARAPTGGDVARPAGLEPTTFRSAT
jgi:hypothetical protein